MIDYLLLQRNNRKDHTTRRKQMLNWKHIGQKFINPPFSLFCFLSLLSAISLFLIFYYQLQEEILSNIIYVLSAYCLFIWILRMILMIQKEITNLKRYNMFEQFLTDTEYKTKISLYLSLIINILYSVYEAVFGMLYHSIWFGTVACYYMILSSERFLLLKYIHKKNCPTTILYRKYRFCGILLMALNIVTCGMCILVICNGQTATYPGHMIYAVAGYCFYNLGFAIFNVVKTHKSTNPIYGASKILNLSTALFSMFTLQNAMIAKFGTDREFQRMMNVITGAVVFLILLSLSVYMISKGTRMLQKSRTIR